MQPSSQFQIPSFYKKSNKGNGERVIIINTASVPEIKRINIIKM